ncbi:MAG: FprA family A-type flavoprotein [Lentimicrobiaceae bacterium]|nr:FprA family A-type flavoprotein [Lentimicrobiaceae bacterium]MCB9023773.1 FprA family A-type flavoprotein [Lentimicrobiaceae bacterium]MCO5265296.1 FprA family A-type flavoprotein [Lentimicrobium sp.]HPG32392.1 FprA family A-type flavoprotein [Lentimicrobium sp.]
MKDKQILDVTNDVKWIGVLDYDIVTFDVVMETKYGTTYNSYFIDAEKPAIIETTKEKFWDTYRNKIERVCNPSDIEYIILDHTEPDHSGNLHNLLKIAPNATVIGSGNALRYLKDMLGYEFKSKQVKDGDTLSLGNKTLKFIGAPNLHWPDSIYTYLTEDKVLFTCDSFGAHYCSELMFDDLVGDYADAFKYYFDVILKPYSKFMVKAIEKIRPLDIEQICTGHGPILRSTWQNAVNTSEELARQALQLPDKRRVFIGYVSAYHNTAQLAESIAEGIRSAGEIDVRLHDIETMPLGEIDEELSKAAGFILGTPTINQNILLQIYQVFALINPLRDKGKLAGAFGSYGWSGEGLKLMESNLTTLKLKLAGESLFIKFTPHSNELEKARAYGNNFGKLLLEQELIVDSEC